ncbi:hypothetical protein K443DRAFT_286349 [Laccaria amethystina LaAM-08-1]|uniref:Uncharacterized protein n=1 Tax=Laccaria amethystina LaAM-08-1 TaxID=1095629 RepID=A0A0C9XM70_9AGAR|nr:hypothetical protein K443DRAFT_286349 [Laccaria amethystina LaAM-08-1]
MKDSRALLSRTEGHLSSGSFRGRRTCHNTLLPICGVHTHHVHPTAHYGRPMRAGEERWYRCCVLNKKDSILSSTATPSSRKSGQTDNHYSYSYIIFC